MSDDHSLPAARGFLARLVAMLALLAGVGLAASMPCSDGMTAAVAIGPAYSCPEAPGPQLNDSAVAPARAGHSSSADPDHAAMCGTWEAIAAVTAVAGGSPNPGGVGGMLAACLTMLVAAVVALYALRPAKTWSSPLAPAVRPRPYRTLPVRQVGLAQLCVLRT